MILVPPTVVDLAHLVAAVVVPDGGQRRSRRNALAGLHAVAETNRSWAEAVATLAAAAERPVVPAARTGA
jgi:hypothetical protein